MKSVRVAIGIGSNIDAEKNLKAASDMLRKIYSDVRFSSVYRTAARDYEDQDDFLNAVAVFDTTDSAEVVSEKLQTAENTLGKALPFKSGPRTIDLDLLLYGDAVLQTTNYQLVIPHPRMHERRFVLEPLSELVDPSERHPLLKKTWKELLKSTNDQRSELL